MNGDSTRPRLVRFGVFELDLRTRELRKAGVFLNLPEQPLQILESLLEKRGSLVTREELRQRLWPGDTFVDYEHGLNAAVKRLRDVLGDSADTPRFIETLPRRGYRFICPVEPEPAEAQNPAPDIASRVPVVVTDEERPPRRRWVWLATASLGLIAVAVGIAAWRRPLAGTADPAARVVPLTSLNGWETDPTFSPDGDRVAFTWDGENGDNSDIYVTVVGSTQVQRLTTAPERDFLPSWSPDGRHIAFLRFSAVANRPELHVMSAVGGTDLKVSDFPAWGQISWSRDGRYLAVSRGESKDDPDGVPGIYLVPTHGGEPRALTRAKVVGNLVGHRAPTFSPDGRHMAYVSCPQSLACYVEVLELDSSLTPIGPARQLTPQSFNIMRRLAWTRDGTSVIFDNEAGYAAFHLWRVGLDAGSQPERIEVAGAGARTPAAAPSRDRLAFTRQSFDTDIYAFERGRQGIPVVRSSFTDFTPAYSPDGQRLAFCSSRSGESVDIWVAASDGTGAKRLTTGPGRWQCSPHWSPDGKHIVFDSREATTQHIWIVDAEGGVPRQITHQAGAQMAPTWSRDGRWIYYLWFDEQTQGLWRSPVSSGPAQRMRPDVSFGMESADGRSLLYTPQVKGANGGPLLEVPLTGGPARQLVECVRGDGAFAAGRQGLFYIPCDPAGKYVVHLLRTETGRDEVVGELDSPAPSPFHELAVSPDGGRILFTKQFSTGADVMMVEYFK